MDFFSIECFARIVQMRSFSDAAAELFISQSSLSKHLKKLEEELGVDLINRGYRNIKLTEAGEVFLDFAQSVLKEKHDLDNRINEMIGNETLVIGRVGFMYDRDVLISNKIASFIMHEPTMRIDVTANTAPKIIEQLLENRLDVAFLVKMETHDGALTSLSMLDMEQVEIYELESESMLLAVSLDSPLASKEEVEWEELKNEVFILLGDEHLATPVIIHELKNHGIENPRTLLINEIVSAFTMIGYNYGIGLFSKVKELQNSQVRYIRIKDPIRRSIVLVVRKDNNKKITKRFIKNTVDRAAL